MQNKPVKQHIVPKVYLKNFTDNKNMINVYDIKKDQFRKQPPKTTTIYKDFYTIEKLDDDLESELNGDKYYIEHFLNKEIEKDFKTIIEKFKKDDKLNKDDKIYIAKFATFQYLRTPMFKKTFEFNLENAFKKMNELIFSNDDYVKSQLKKIDSDINYEEVEDIQNMILEGNYNVNFPKEHYLGFMLKFSEKMLNILLNQKWYFLISPSKSGFVTSDHPFAMEKFNDQPSWTGYGLVNTEKTIPLTPEICLFIGDYGSRDIKLKIDRKKVRNINLRTIFSANRFVMSNNIGLLRGMINQADKHIKNNN
jgi:hypothetical protein